MQTKKFKDWRHLITRDLSLVEYYMIVESYAKNTVKDWGWQYSGGCALSKKGIMLIYRRNRYCITGANYFIKHKRKKSYLENFLKKSRHSVKKVDKTISFIKKRLLTNPDKEELIQLFERAYKEFKGFWSVQNFTVTLDTSFNGIGRADYLGNYKGLIMKMRKLTQGRTLEFEKLIDKILNQLALKTRINKVLLNNSTPKEIINNQINLKQARKRAKAYFIIVENKKIKIFTNPRVISSWKKFLKKITEQKTDLDKIIGKPAYKGVVKGKTRVVVSKKDLLKLKPGEILVTPMTELDFVPYLKKVSAIITNEGGITCHAAIVSRELKIPCIIGTKIATKVFKDGDIIEVDANKGVVRKIE